MSFDAATNWKEDSYYWNLDKEQDFVLQTIEAIRNGQDNDAKASRERWGNDPVKFLRAYRVALAWRYKGFGNESVLSDRERSSMNDFTVMLEESELANQKR